MIRLNLTPASCFAYRVANTGRSDISNSTISRSRSQTLFRTRRTSFSQLGKPHPIDIPAPINRASLPSALMFSGTSEGLTCGRFLVFFLRICWSRSIFFSSQYASGKGWVARAVDSEKLFLKEIPHYCPTNEKRLAINQLSASFHWWAVSGSNARPTD